MDRTSKTATYSVAHKDSKSVLFTHSTMLDERISSKLISSTIVITGINNELTVATWSCNYEYCIIDAIICGTSMASKLLHFGWLLTSAITRNNPCDLELIALLIQGQKLQKIVILKYTFLV